MKVTENSDQPKKSLIGKRVGISTCPRHKDPQDTAAGVHAKVPTIETEEF